MASLQAGAVYGYVGAVSSIVSRMKAELDGDVKVVATGGLARLIGDETGVFPAIDRTLTLDGLRLIYENFRK